MLLDPDSAASKHPRSLFFSFPRLVDEKNNSKNNSPFLSLFLLPNKKTAAIEGDTRPPGADEAVDLHFVAFVESGGKLWELDGRKVAPVEHGATSGETFLKDAARAIEREFVRSETAEGSLNFNLLALVGGGGGEGGGGHGGEGGGGGGVGE